MEEALPRIIDLMRAGLDVVEPSVHVHLRAQKGTGARSAFCGSYDWHSNLFAHWALLTHARTSGDSALGAEILARIPAAALEQERRIVRELDTDRLLTYPYDQTWLLVLLAELERHTELGSDPERPALTREFRRELEHRLLSWLEQSPFPENEHRAASDPGAGGRSAPEHEFFGFYRSWLFTWLQLHSCGTVTEGGAGRLLALRTARITPLRPRIAAQLEPHPFDFLWLPSLLVLIDGEAGGDGEPLPFDAGETRALPHAVDLRSVHVMGVEVSRLWGWAALAAGGDDEAAAAYDARLAEILGREDLWAEDFTVVTHWVPQFLYYAHWVRRGRP